MDARDELVNLLADTHAWAARPNNVHTQSVYAAWDSPSALLAELESHLVDARNGMADLPRLARLYLPTGALCEVTASDRSAKVLATLAARFDAWYASVRAV